MLDEAAGELLHNAARADGVHLHFGEEVRACVRDNGAVTKVITTSGEEIATDLLGVGLGLTINLELCAGTPIRTNTGIITDQHLETDVAGIFAAGDIARWPDSHTGDAIRVEHWVVAERQGQTAARNMLGAEERFDAVPFFWSQHYDMPVNYVGHAEQWDEIAIDGSVDAKDCLLRYKRNGRVLAVASIFRDGDSLKAELAMEQGASP